MTTAPLAVPATGEPDGNDLPDVGPFPDEDDRPLPMSADDTTASTRGRGQPGRPLAKPPVRRLALDLGVDLADHEPNGTRRHHHPRRRSRLMPAETEPPSDAAPVAEGWDGLPREERVPVRGAQGHGPSGGGLRLQRPACHAVRLHRRHGVHGPAQAAGFRSTLRRRAALAANADQLAPSLWPLDERQR